MKTYAAQYYHMERPRLAAEFSFEVEEDKRSGPDINRSDTTTTYSEILDIETSGWIYHPALVVYSFVFSPEWEQVSEQSNDSDPKKTNTFLQGYNAEFVFLQYKPYTLTLRGSKYMTTFNSNFAKKSKSETSIFGATLNLRYKVLPSSLNYVHTESDQTGFFATSSTRDQVTFRANYTKIGGHTSIDVSYLNNRQITASSITETTTNNGRLQNTYDPPNFRQVKLKSLFAFRDLKTDFSERTVRTWTENLKIQHRENLLTNYTMRIERTTTGTEESLAQNIGYGLSHTLYENLSTGLNVNGGKSSSTSRSQDSYGGALNWNYVRKIPWGKLNANVGHSYRVTDVRVASDLAEIFDEPVALTGPLGTFLANKHVDINSIVVTDINQIPYILDIDYRVSNVSSFTRITIIPSGSIPSGATVLVDYQHQTDPPFDYGLFEQNYGVSLDLWNVWKIHYNFNKTKQDHISGIQPDTLSKSLSHRAGTELNWKWSRTKFEYFLRKSTELPLERWSADETIIIRPSRRIFMSVSGNVGETTFKDTGETESFQGGRAKVQIITSRRTSLSFNGFRNELSGEAVDTVDTGFSSVFDWVWAIYNGNIIYRFTEEKDNMSAEKFKNHLIAFVIKRELF